MTDKLDKKASRRFFLQGLGSLSALALLHCAASSDTADDASSGSGTNGSTDTDTDTTTTTDGGTFSSDGAVSVSTMAVGSGAFLDGKDYGNPFTSDAAGTSCTVYKSATKGPCHSNTYQRKDVSDGLTGLPTRIELLVVDSSCNPVADAIVEIWYASPAGTYSKAAEAIDNEADYNGSLSDLNVGFCTGNNAEAAASNWLRGFQKTDATGRVVLDGIFPGWYSGRAPHIHFVITASGHSTLTSQVLFDETLTTAIYTQHSAYKSRGDKDTTNARDNIGLGDAAAMSYAQQSDGALVVWKKITVA